MKAILGFFDNENPIVRIGRILIMAGISGAALAIAQTLPGIDIPGDYDAIIIAGGTAVLAGVDKWARSHES